MACRQSSVCTGNLGVRIGHSNQLDSICTILNDANCYLSIVQSTVGEEIDHDARQETHWLGISSGVYSNIEAQQELLNRRDAAYATECAAIQAHASI